MLPLSPEPSEDIFDTTSTMPIQNFPREKLQTIEKIGEGRFGDVRLCEVLGEEDVKTNTVLDHELSDKFVVVHTLRVNSFKEEFEQEVKALSRLTDINVSRLLGACLDSEPVCAVREYGAMGDLCQFLQDHVAESATPLAPSASALR